MVNYEPKHGDMEMWLICVAIGENHELINEMKKMQTKVIQFFFCWWSRVGF